MRKLVYQQLKYSSDTGAISYIARIKQLSYLNQKFLMSDTFYDL